MRFQKSCLLFVLVLVVATSGCIPKQEAGYGPREPVGPAMTAVVVAYEPEMIGVEEAIAENPNASILSELTFKGVRYSIGEYEGEPIVVFATGMSIANAAMTMQMAFEYFPIKQVVYMGIAGAVNPELQPGDVVIPERWAYHDESVYVNPDPKKPGAFIQPDYYENFLSELDERRITKPHTPVYKPFGFIHPDEVLIIKDGMPHPVAQSYFEATPRLLDVARDAIATVEPVRVIPERDAIFSVGGNGVTGSVFLDNREYRKWTREIWNAEVREMESAAIGQVCHINEIDWIIIRAVSD